MKRSVPHALAPVEARELIRRAIETYRRIATVVDDEFRRWLAQAGKAAAC